MMLHQGKCPKCEKVPQYVHYEPMDIREQFATSGGYRGISYRCPYCLTILSVAIDPIALKADVVKAVCKALGVKPKP